MGEPFKNSDRELWRERPDDYYADSIHVTASGAIGINCGGRVFVMPVRRWHLLAVMLSDNPAALLRFDRESVRDTP